MSLSLQGEQKRHIDFLASQSNKGEFSIFILSVLFSKFIFHLVFTQILDNILSATILSTSESESDIDNASRAVLKLLIDAKKLILQEREFRNHLKLLTELNEEQRELLSSFYLNEKILDDLITSGEYSFRDLQWRLEAKVSNIMILMLIRI